MPITLLDAYEDWEIVNEVVSRGYSIRPDTIVDHEPTLDDATDQQVMAEAEARGMYVSYKEPTINDHTDRIENLRWDYLDWLDKHKTPVPSLEKIMDKFFKDTIGK